MSLLVSGLSKKIDDTPILREITFRADPGERIVLLGLNGAGKTTLLRCLAGLADLTSGSVEIEGFEPGTVGARAATSFIPDQPVLYDDLSLGEHIEYVARMHNQLQWEDRALHLVEAMALDDRVDALPSTFSRGLRQRSSIVVGLVRPFSLLLVDEPFVGLDRPSRARFLDLIDEVADGGATVILATHQDDFADRATRCLGLRDGVLHYDGPIEASAITELVPDRD